MLEPRQLPAGFVPLGVLTPVTQAVPNETVDRALSLGDLTASPVVVGTGTIGNGPAAGADVAWYHFVLDRPARVSLTVGASQAGGAFRGALSLYDEDPLDFGDPLDPTGHRLMAQAQASAPGQPARLDAVLAPGGYDVAVSGAGNVLFNPLLAGSGYAGGTGDYNLLISATDLDFGPGAGPAVLWSDPAPGASPTASPLAIRVGLSGPIDPASAVAGQTVQLVYNPGGHFGDGNDVAVPLASVNFSAAADELQLFPQQALAPGSYKVVLAGDSSSGNPVLTSPSGTPLGESPSFPAGLDDVFTFRVTGVEGGKAADDTPATAHDLGDLTAAGLVQAAGAVGDDPFYDPSSPDPRLNPGNDVDLYHFRVTGPGRYAFRAEVFAGRIGSPLDPGVALYKRDPATGALQLVAGNDNTHDGSVAGDGSAPLALDSALFSGLTAGDYYVAVSSGSNTPSPLEQHDPAAGGYDDPNVSHSGQNGFGTGPYVLNLLVQPAPAAPRVVKSAPYDTQTLAAAPTQLTVQFSEAVNLQQLAYTAFQQPTLDSSPSVYVLGADGTKYVPRLQSFDPSTDRATFLMLDALPNGSYELHLSGAAGLSDLAGDPLVGNTAGGDYVVRFKVNDHTQAGHGNPHVQVAYPTASGVQDLGTLFPHDWQSGVTVNRGAGASWSGTEDDFRFQVLQSQVYGFSTTWTGCTTGTPLWLTDAQGNPVNFQQDGPDGTLITAMLTPGVYVLHAGGWSASQAPQVSYQMSLTLAGNADNAPSLVSGPGPALQMRISGLSTPASFGPLSSPAAPSGPSAHGGETSGVGPAGAGPTALTAHAGSGLSGDAPGLSGSFGGGGVFALASGPVGGVTGGAGPVEAAAAPQLALATPSGGLIGQALARTVIATQWDEPLGEGQPVEPGVQAAAETAVTETSAVAPVKLAAEAVAPQTGEPAAEAAEPSWPAAPPADAGATAVAVADGSASPPPPAEMPGDEDETRRASQADLGWLAGLSALGLFTVTCLRRYVPGRALAARKGTGPSALPPPHGLGLAKARPRTARREHEASAAR